MLTKAKDAKFPLKEKDIESIFSNLPEIIQENSKLLSALEQNFIDWKPCQTIGDVFCQYVCCLLVLIFHSTAKNI